MINVEYEVIDTGLVNAYAELAAHAADFVNDVTNRTVNATADDLLADFGQEPGPVKTPIAWTSDRQRRYVMAQKRQGLIPTPYVRSHAVSQGWRITVIYAPGEMSRIELTNAVEATAFVVGFKQQRWHNNTGWYYAPDKAAHWQTLLTDRIETDLIKAFYAVEPK